MLARVATLHSFTVLHSTPVGKKNTTVCLSGLLRGASQLLPIRDLDDNVAANMSFVLLGRVCAARREGAGGRPWTRSGFVSSGSFPKQLTYIAAIGVCESLSAF